MPRRNSNPSAKRRPVLASLTPPHVLGGIYVCRDEKGGLRDTRTLVMLTTMPDAKGRYRFAVVLAPGSARGFISLAAHRFTSEGWQLVELPDGTKVKSIKSKKR